MAHFCRNHEYDIFNEFHLDDNDNDNNFPHPNNIIAATLPMAHSITGDAFELVRQEANFPDDWTPAMMSNHLGNRDIITFVSNRHVMLPVQAYPHMWDNIHYIDIQLTLDDIIPEYFDQLLDYLVPNNDNFVEYLNRVPILRHNLNVFNVRVPMHIQNNH